MYPQKPFLLPSYSLDCNAATSTKINNTHRSPLPQSSNSLPWAHLSTNSATTEL